MIAVTTDHLYAGALGAAVRVVVVVIVLAAMSALIWALLIGAVVFVEWLDGWRAWWRGDDLEQHDQIRPPTAIDPFVVKPQLGGTYHIVNERTGAVVGTAGWLWEAERLRSEHALAWYRERRQERES